MSLLTRLEHITEASEWAGNTGLTTRLGVMYPVIMRSLYRAAPWPFIRRRANGSPTVDPNTSSVTMTPAQFYTGEAAVPRDGLLGISRAVLVDAAGRANDLVVLAEEEADPEMLVLNGKQGRPTHAIVSRSGLAPGTDGVAWKVQMYVPPDTEYGLAVYGQCLPAEDLTNPNVKPVFPADDLIIHALYVYCLRHQQDERAFAELQNLRSELTNFKSEVLSTSGRHKRMQLARSRFGDTREGAVRFQSKMWSGW